MNIKTYLILRITFTFIFLILSTFIWINKKDNLYHEYRSDIEFNEVVFSNLKKDNQDDNNNYILNINNKENIKKDIKIYIIPDILSSSVTNNFIRYQIDDNSIKTLNMDGIVYALSLDAKESIQINLKLWLSDTYDGENNYFGRVVVM